MEHLTDRELWVRAAAGDAPAFGLIYERHARGVLTFALWRMSDRAQAEDATRPAGRPSVPRARRPRGDRVGRTQLRRGGRGAGHPGRDSPLEAVARTRTAHRPSRRRMTACSAPGQGVIVYPTKLDSPSVCARLGQKPLPADFAPFGARGAAIRKALAPLEAPTRCSTLAETMAMARNALNGAGLQDVAIGATPPNRNSVCAFATADGLRALVIAPREGSTPPADRSIPLGG